MLSKDIFSSTGGKFALLQYELHIALFEKTRDVCSILKKITSIARYSTGFLKPQQHLLREHTFYNRDAHDGFAPNGCSSERQESRFAFFSKIFKDMLSAGDRSGSNQHRVSAFL